MSDTSFFIVDYRIKESENPFGEGDGFVEIYLENSMERSIYGNEHIENGSWFGDKISFTDEHCYYIYQSSLYKCELDTLPYSVYPPDELQESENGYYNIISEWHE